MDGETLLTYPYVIVRLACRYCARVGAYRLVRLAVKFGCEATLADVVVRLAADCPHWKSNKRWRRAAASTCPISRRRARCLTIRGRGSFA
jgi:hypothetical protein